MVTLNVPQDNSVRPSLQDSVRNSLHEKRRQSIGLNQNAAKLQRTVFKHS